MLVLGYAEGATLGAGLLLLNRWAVAGGALIRPRLPLVPEVPPFLSGTPVWVSAGCADRQVPAEETEQLATILRAENP